jgi:hypothetical protein
VETKGKSSKVPDFFYEKCDCGLVSEHIKGYHDWCCQICGGNHVEEICPEKQSLRKSN